jgi:hypothetical protein
MRLAITTAVAGLLLLVVIFELLRRRQLREKYAFLWIGFAIVALPLAAFPRAFDHIAGALGIASGVSLVFFLAFLFLVLVCIHLSWEVSRLEEETRTLAENQALLKTELEGLRSSVGRGEAVGGPAADG